MSIEHPCDQCGKPAICHSVEIVKGQKIVRHYCEFHAQQAGLLVPGITTPINEMLTHFVKMHSSGAAAPGEKADSCPPSPPCPPCPGCGLTMAQFRESSLLGCPQCYEAFGQPLASLIERNQDGATHHIGKMPHRAGDSAQRQQMLFRMRKKLNDAVIQENYEQAARLRDELRRMEEPQP